MFHDQPLHRFCASLLFLLLTATLGRADDLLSDYEGYNNAKYGVFPKNEHKSTNSVSPVLNVNEWHKERMSKSGSHIFLRHDVNGYSGPELDTSPLILSADDLSVVYLDRRFQSVFDVRVQQDRGQDYLTFFGGPISEIGIGNGYSYMFDTSYRQAYKVSAHNLKVKADLHEFQLTRDGTALITAYDTILSLNSRAPPNRGPQKGKQLRDSIFQEIDLDAEKAIFQWRASDHIPLDASFEKKKVPWDFFHLNSIEKASSFCQISLRIKFD